jgi:hypothetical protein
MKFYVLTKAGIPVSILFESPFPVTNPDISAHTFDEPFPDLNVCSWNADTERYEVTSTQLTKLMFLNRFTVSERVAIRASTDPVVQDIMQLFDAASYITITDSSTITAVNYLVTAGLLTSVRAQEILT